MTKKRRAYKNMKNNKFKQQIIHLAMFTSVKQGEREDKEMLSH